MSWIAERAQAFDSSGIRKVFELAAEIKDPINLSIGQPDFDVPENVKSACVDAIESGKNAYALTRGVPSLRDALLAELEPLGHADRDLFVSSGTSGGLVLAMLALVNPGDEVIIFDPYFVMYAPLCKLAGGVPVVIDTYPDFRIDLDKVKHAITPKTKLILLNSPGNPTGVVATKAEVEGLASLAAENQLALISDEIYRIFCYDDFHSPVDFYDKTIVIDGFSKSHAMTGWRVGWVHGPADVIDAMVRLQQYSFVCSPQPAQWAAIEALRTPVQKHVADYAAKRDRLIAGLEDKFSFSTPGGAFYLFPEAPGGDGDAFVAAAIEQSLLIIPGSIFSHRKTHFRVSYAAPDETIDRGIEVLRSLV